MATVHLIPTSLALDSIYEIEQDSSLTLTAYGLLIPNQPSIKALGRLTTDILSSDLMSLQLNEMLRDEKHD